MNNELLRQLRLCKRGRWRNTWQGVCCKPLSFFYLNIMWFVNTLYFTLSVLPQNVQCPFLLSELIVLFAIRGFMT